jgi:hypothetical protein
MAGSALHTQSSQGENLCTPLEREDSFPLERFFEPCLCMACGVSGAMHHDFDMLKDPMFWVALCGGILPIAMGGALLVWAS